MPVVANEHHGDESKLSAHLRISTINAMDRAAEAGALLALANKPFSLYSVAACIENEGYQFNELTMIAWAAELGYREGVFRSDLAGRA